MGENKRDVESLKYWLLRAQMLDALLNLPSIPWPALQEAADLGQMCDWKEKGLRFFKVGNEYHTTPANYKAVVTALSLGVSVDAVQQQAAPAVSRTIDPTAMDVVSAIEQRPWFVKPWWTREQAAEYLDMSVDTLDRRIADGKLKKYAGGRKREFRLKASEVKLFGNRAG